MLNFDHAVIRHKVTGRIIAFANLMKAGDQSELSMDLMRYDPEGSNAAMDALFADMLLWGKEQGFAWFSLGQRHCRVWKTANLPPHGIALAASSMNTERNFITSTVCAGSI